MSGTSQPINQPCSANLCRSTRLMATYDDMMLDHIPPKLLPGEREHVMVFQDESIFHTNKYHRRSWLVRDQQPIRKKGNGWVLQSITIPIKNLIQYLSLKPLTPTEPPSCQSTLSRTQLLVKTTPPSLVHSLLPGPQTPIQTPITHYVISMT
jgi:hypothetical protein